MLDSRLRGNDNGYSKLDDTLLVTGKKSFYLNPNETHFATDDEKGVGNLEIAQAVARPLLKAANAACVNQEMFTPLCHLLFM